MIRSIASRSLPDSEILYQNKKVTVTPSWLEVKNTSYSIRYIRQLTLKNHSPPRVAAGIVFLLSVIMCIWQGLKISEGSGPVVLNWSLLVACVILLLVSSFIAFAMRARYRLDVRFVRGPELVSIARATKADVLALHEALALAMDWYRGEAEPANEPVG